MSDPDRSALLNWRRVIIHSNDYADVEDAGGELAEAYENLEAALLTAQQRIQALEQQVAAQTAGIARLREQIERLPSFAEINHVPLIYRRDVLALLDPAGASPGEPRP